MAERLTRITTKKGDTGETSIATGERLSKASLRIDAIGDVDELNAALGLLKAELQVMPETQAELCSTLCQFCHAVQNELFNVGGELASPDHVFVKEEAVALLDNFIAKHNAKLPPLKEFVVPGQNKASAHAHMARCVARRAERSLVKLHQREVLSQQLLAYINRISDALFVIARLLGRLNCADEPQWQR